MLTDIDVFEHVIDDNESEIKDDWLKSFYIILDV